VNEVLVDIQSLTKVFDKTRAPAIQNIHLKIPKGSIFGLVGPDGSGKTTFLRLIAGLLKPTFGYIKVLGFDTIKESSSVHEVIGYMPQKFGLYEDLTVKENLELFAELKGLKKEEKKEVFERLLTFTSLKEFTERLAGNLSGGMKQKLGLACAMITKPKLLLLDEPSVGVDPFSRRELWKMVKDLVNEGIGVIWSTSYLDEAEKCDFVCLLNLGEVIFSGVPQELTKRVNERVFLLTDVKDKRKEQINLLNQPDIADVQIQGQDLRVVVKNKDFIFQTPFKPIPPRFEDAFIDFLGGVSRGDSPLSQYHRPIDSLNEMMIEAKGLTKKFGNFTAADNISLVIKKGEIFGLLGPNGAGKTTTFKMMCGLLRPSSGNALVNGYDLQMAPGKARSKIGYMAQKFSLYGNLTSRQNMEFFAGIYGLDNSEIKNQVSKMNEIFELKPYLDELADLLPLGFKQRLALSCSIMHEPSILFLDEPTSGVDPITRREFWQHIYSLVGNGITVMVTTHFMDEAEYCDRLALVYKSKIIEAGTPDYLKEKAQANSMEEAFINLIENYEKN
jgi:ABC-2 type transport system ATP-binding protein